MFHQPSPGLGNTPAAPRGCRSFSVVVALVLAACASVGGAEFGDSGNAFRLVLMSPPGLPPTETILSVRRGPGARREPVQPPAVLGIHDEFITGRGLEFAEVRFGGQYVKLDQQSAFKVTGIGSTPSIEVAYGRLWFSSALGAPKLEITVRAGAERVVQIRAEGTEYGLEVGGTPEAPTVSLVMIDGQARIQTGTTETTMGPMEEGRMMNREWRQGPLSPGDSVSAWVALNQRIQWALYYPSILDLGDLPEPLDGTAELADSVASYRRGDLLAAMRHYPKAANKGAPDAAGSSELQEPRSASERLYLAALYLAWGRVDEARRLLQMLTAGVVGASTDRTERLAHAFEVLIAAVTGASVVRDQEPSTATEWLAESYFQQSRVSLPDERANPEWEAKHYRSRDERLRRALVAAQRAVASRTAASTPGYAEVRLAEMHFSFGDLSAAESAQRLAVGEMPGHAPAHVLAGYLFAARDHLSDATAAFQKAIDLDPGLGGAWLGRGLCHFRRGEIALGLADVQQAVAAEPNRAFFRSYLGKAYAEAADAVDRFWSPTSRDAIRASALVDGTDASRRTLLDRKSGEELATARRLDPEDPTSLLYSALLKRSQNQVNGAVRDLEASKERNDQRALYRSGFLLDQDRAVRGVTLAQVYRDAGMNEVAVREASRAATADYGNASAHQFLAGGYDALRDVRQLNLRYDTPWQTELLLANLLKPVGAGSLSQGISQQEYSRLFEREYTGFYSDTEYRSRGDWRQMGSVYGWQGRVAYALDEAYESVNGYRPNQDVEALTLWAKAKIRLTPRNEVYLELRRFDFESGDLAQYADPSDASRGLRVQERQEPLILAGYHHEWDPANHSLFVFSRLGDTLEVTDPNPERWLVHRLDTGEPNSRFRPEYVASDLDYQGEMEVYSFEYQQIWRADAVRWSGVSGVRYQFGDFPTAERMEGVTGYLSRPAVIEPLSPVSDRRVDPGFDRATLYSYNTYECLVDRVWLTGGLAAESLRLPRNHRFSPVDDASDRTEIVAPKGGVVVRLDDRSAVQAAYSQWLGGISLEQSFGLEPSQVAGFTQNHRDIAPSSLVGALAGSENEMIGVLLDRRFSTDTFVGLQWQRLSTEVDRSEGSFDAYRLQPIRPGQLERFLEYQEQTVAFTLDQLIAEDWAVNFRYRLTDSDLRDHYDGAELFPNLLSQHQGALLHELGISGRWTHRTGLFAVVHATWYSQELSGDTAAVSQPSFWQVNVEAGYRFLRRRAEARIGVLNLTDVDDRLHPVSPYPEWPPDRTFFAALRLNF
ncbi:MAG: hypothetical protein JNK85_23950 [Verrucomicrobiales bacterium]|nr:hypothetical protein [Verrucomicrobiales bacterium]